LRTKVDNSLDVQELAEKRQNRTFVRPKLTMVVKEEIQPKKVTLRGNKRAEVFQFMKELVQSNTTDNEWNVKQQQRDVDLCHFFEKKNRKPYNCINLSLYKEYLEAIPNTEELLQKSENLEVEGVGINSPTQAIVSELVKHDTSNDMSSFNEQLISQATTSDTAVVTSIQDILARLNKLEAANLALVKENEELRKELKEKKESKSLENERQKSKPNNKKTPGTQHKRATTPEIQQIVGFEQSTLGSDLPKFSKKPKVPDMVKPKDSAAVKARKIKDWFNYNKEELEQHNREVVNSFTTSKTFAQQLRDIGLPKQKIRYTNKQQRILVERPKVSIPPQRNTFSHMETLV